jgi:hypothetical protein
MIDIPIGHFKVIHCFLPPGKAHDLLRRLRRELDIPSAFAHHARGGGLSTRRGRESFYYTEMEVMTLLAPAEQADEVFAFIYRAADLGKPRAGMLLMEKAQMGAALNLPEGIPDEE